MARRAPHPATAETAKKHKVSDATIYAWRKHFGQLDVADVILPALQGGEDDNSKA